MNKLFRGWLAIPALAFGLVLVLGASAHAAGEWEWTKEQGWMMSAGVSRPTPKEQLQYAYELEQRGEFMDSARQYFLLVQNFPASQEAGVGLQRLARCLFEMENYYTSYKAVEQVILTYPNTGRISDLVEIELRIAKKMMVSQTPDILSGRETNTRDFNIRRALEIVDSVIKHDPYGPVAAEAYLVKGEAHLFINEVQAARKAFETLRDEFPRSDFVERARLGILTCDSLMGQASPKELADQIEVVREAERERAQRRRDAPGDFDEVEESIRQLAEVEAAKMLEQATQYRKMGTRKSVGAAQFLYKEIVRRYPNTPQAEEAMALLGNTTLPKEQSRIMRTVKNININPFTLNRDPEPPWIVPQIDPDDMVMVDSGLGPIAGVPETSAPPTTTAAAGVRPQALGEGSVEVAGVPRNYTPIEAAPSPTPAPSFIDAVPEQMSYPQPPTVAYGGPSSYGGMPPPAPGYAQPTPAPAYQSYQNNPLPTASESDLVGVPASALSYGGGYTPPAPVYQPSTPAYLPVPEAGGYAPAPVQGPNAPQPVLGSPDHYTSMSDLVGPAGRSTYVSPPIPEYGGYESPAPYSGAGGGSYADYQMPDPYGTPAPIPYPGTPAPIYVDPMSVQPAPGYAVPEGLRPPAAASSANGGWTLEDDFR